MKVVTIGRSTDSNNNVVVNDQKVSRSHLQIIKDDNGNYYAIDLGSTNGTFINGTRINGKTQLQKGDTIVIGNTTLSWEKYFTDKVLQSEGETKKVEEKPKKNNKKLYIIVTSVIVCVIIGVICLIMYNSKQAEKEERHEKITQAYSKETLEAKEAQKDAEKEAQRAQQAQHDAEVARKRAENESKTAEAKTRIAEAAKEQAVEDKNKAVKAARDAQQQAAEDVAEAEKARRRAEEEKAAAEKAERKAVEEKTAAEEARRKAEEEKIAAKESEILTGNFYELLSVMSDKKIKKVCADLKLDGTDKETLKTYFKKSDNKVKKEVIELINKVNGMSEPAEEPKNTSEQAETAEQEQNQTEKVTTTDK